MAGQVSAGCGSGRRGALGDHGCGRRRRRWGRRAELAGKIAGVSQTAKLGWVIVYVPDVEEALSFYERAFGLARTFVDASASFGQLDTGSTSLAFATEERAGREFEGDFQRARLDRDPFNVELCLIFDDVTAAFRHAVASGCTPLAEPERKPHGQTASFVRDPFGTLVEIAS